VRPAETTAGAGSIALAVAYIAGVRDPETIAAVGVLIGLVPGAVTFLVDHGGIVGVAHAITKGRAPRRRRTDR
jgi:hypothetical protein